MGYGIRVETGGGKQAGLISVLVINYNGVDLLAPCLDSLRRSRCRPLEVLILDNGSVDDSVAYARRHHPDFRVLDFGSNRGYAAGNNAGILSSRGRYVLLLNNDTVIDPDALGLLGRYMEQAPQEIGGCMPKLLFHAQPEQVNSVGVGLDRSGNSYSLGREDAAADWSDPREIFCPHGAAALYRREMLDDVGLLDEAFFMFQEEVDLGWRARLRGWRFGLVPEARVWHHEQVASRRANTPTQYLLERNRIWLLTKNAAAATLLRMLPELLRYEWDCLKYCCWKRDASRLRARWDALAGLQPMLRERRRIQRGRRLPESAIRAWLNAPQ